MDLRNPVNEAYKCLNELKQDCQVVFLVLQTPALLMFMQRALQLGGGDQGKIKQQAKVLAGFLIAQQANSFYALFSERAVQLKKPAMEPANYDNTGTWKKPALMATIGVVTVILLITSTTLLTIGYMNAFGNVGLGILGAGAVLYFGSVIFLCGSCIWVKNTYYPDEMDFIVKPSSSDETYLPKPVPNRPHSEMPLLSESTTGRSTIYSPTSTDTWLTDSDACFSDSDAFLLTPLSAEHRISKPVSEQRLEMGTHFIYPSTFVKN